MKGTFIIKFTTEEENKGIHEKEVHILGVFNESENALGYIRKYYNNDVTNGDNHIKVIEECLKNTERKNGDIECYVKKVYQYESITYTDVMEMVVPTELSVCDDPMKDIYSIYN